MTAGKGGRGEAGWSDQHPRHREAQPTLPPVPRSLSAPKQASRNFGKGWVGFHLVPTQPSRRYKTLNIFRSLKNIQELLCPPPTPQPHLVSFRSAFLGDTTQSPLGLLLPPPCSPNIRQRKLATGRNILGAEGLFRRRPSQHFHNPPGQVKGQMPGGSMIQQK